MVISSRIMRMSLGSLIHKSSASNQSRASTGGPPCSLIGSPSIPVPHPHGSRRSGLQPDRLPKIAVQICLPESPVEELSKHWYSFYNREAAAFANDYFLLVGMPNLSMKLLASHNSSGVAGPSCTPPDSSLVAQESWQVQRHGKYSCRYLSLWTYALSSAHTS